MRAVSPVLDYQAGKGWRQNSDAFSRRGMTGAGSLLEFARTWCAAISKARSRAGRSRQSSNRVGGEAAISGKTNRE